ncbi:MAG: DUF3124 domain-containing protein [Bacteroidetes bacterium]|nr:DUF3124 domain-containing protein [Bacteroidota bacterium]
MKLFYTILAFSLTLFACQQEKEISSVSPNNWLKRIAKEPLSDSLQSGRTYLSVYSEIYDLSEHHTYQLTATISLRNTSLTDSIYVFNAVYYDTKGNAIRRYFEKPIFITPMETVEIVIDAMDKTGGTGANFLFDWKTKKNTPDPLFEGVMISTTSQQGLSFTTQGKRIE